MSRNPSKAPARSGAVARPKVGVAKPVRVALLDGDVALHAMFRDHLVVYEPDWQLAAHTHGEPAWQRLRAVPPQLVLLAQTLPDGCGIEWLRRCKRQLPELPVVILTTQGGGKRLLDALRAGANGYWVKCGDASDLVKQLRKVLAGRIVLCAVAEHLLPLAFAGLRQTGVAQWGLSSREGEILSALDRQLTNKEIARALGLASATVHAHLDRIFKKLDVHDRHAAKMKYSQHLLGG